MLGEFGRKNGDLGEEAVSSLKKLFQVPALTKSVRIETIQALGVTGRRSAVKPLMSCLKTNERDILLVVTVSLATLKQRESITPLKNLLMNQLKSRNPDVELMLRVIQGLEGIALDPKGEISKALILTIDAVRNASPDKLTVTSAQRQSLLQAGAAALGQLDYELAAANAAVQCLVRIIANPDPAVRFFVADSLSRIKFVDVRKQLKILSKDKETRVRSAAVRGLGRCALRPGFPKDVRRQIIHSLIDFFLGPDKDLRSIAESGLSNLIEEDFKKTLANLTLVIEAFDKNNKMAFALPFLEALDRQGTVDKEKAVRYHWLLEARARSALAALSNATEKNKNSLIRLALEDARYLSKSQKTKAKERYRRLEAKARLALNEGQAACQLLAKDGKYDESWELWKKGLQMVQKTKATALVQKLINELDKSKLSEKKLGFLKTALKQHNRKDPQTPKNKTPKSGGNK
jgi:HEAT repeat protein